MPDFNSLFTSPGTGIEPPVPSAQPLASDEDLLDLWETIRKEAIDPRHVFVRQWHRNLLYVLNRQWIEYTRDGGWKDKRMAQHIPRPVTNKCKTTVSAIRSIFTAVQLGNTVRPNGTDPKNVSAASTADQLAPLIHEDHRMDSVLMEFDFWLCVTGNAFLHSFVDYDTKHGVIRDPSEKCLQCSDISKTSEIGKANNTCPSCGGTAFTPALDEAGQPIVNEQPKGRPTTIVLSPLELAFVNSYSLFEDLPYVVRMRWRRKSYFENRPDLKSIMDQLVWEKAPSNRSLQLFKNLSQHNDLGIASAYLSDGVGAPNEDGVAEYEVWMKPTLKYPKGLVFRVVGEKPGLIVHVEDAEAIPGPLPYTDVNGTPLFPFAHAAYEHVGGRILGSGPLDVMISKQDQLNQLDSNILMSIFRMGNAVWMWPKGSSPTKITGIPGLNIEWDSLVVGGQAKPERLEGVGPHPSVFEYRKQIELDIEELTGTFDILKGAKPTGVEAFSALQLLDERSKGRFTPTFQARANAYKDWFKIAIELEREFGPNERTLSVLSPARKWTFTNFKRAQLQGAVSVVVENGSTVARTTLGTRATVDHAAQLGMINMQDPDQSYEGLKLFGLTKMVPTTDIQVQGALQKQQAFEDWARNPQAMQQSFMQAQQATMDYQSQLASTPPQPMDPATGMVPPPPPPPSMLASTPLKWHGWYNPIIHRQEFLKWANGDIVREILMAQPNMEALLEQHLVEINQALQQQAMQMQMMTAGPPPPIQGAGRAMRNSNANAGQGSQSENPGPT